MSDSSDAFLELLPERSVLRDKSNPARRVIDNTVGVLLDEHDLNTFECNLFLNTATGGFLDLFGRDFGIPRKLNESDSVYRERIILEKLDHLTVDTLMGEYGLTLYSDVESASSLSDVSMVAVSDNPYYSSDFMGIVDSDMQGILDGKFVVGTGLHYITEE